MQSISFSCYVAFGGSQGFNFRLPCSRLTPPIAAQNPEGRPHHGLHINRSRNFPVQHLEGSKDRIREALLKVDLSVSSFDTAWVAMVPSPISPKLPCFPKCIDWILNNQHPDGSWGLPHCDPSLIKDTLSSTLACLLALRRWSVGEDHVQRGRQFIGSNFSSVMDKQLQSPIGFNIIFPGMIGHAISMGLDLPVQKNDMDAMIFKRDLELKSLSRDYSEGRKAYHAFVAEGLCQFQNWQDVMKYQRRNGSLFNSPSTTAAAVIHTQDEKALNYLQSMLRRFGNSVPTIYPLDIYSHLSIVDDLEGFGIANNFSYEIKNILDRTYRCWVQNDEEITSDIATRAMAFRILRMNGYDVASDALAEFDEVNHFNNSRQGYLRDVGSVLELYKASLVKILPDETVLEKVQSWSFQYLKDFSTEVDREIDVVSSEVDYALNFPFYGNLDRLEHKRNIEHYKAKEYRLLKTSYNNLSINNKDVLNVALEEFNFSQSVYRKELELLESWAKENKLDQLEFARQAQAHSCFTAAATIFPPEMSDARICWAKNCVLITVVDDFFDVGGSREELLNLIMLVEKWDGQQEKDFYSKHVEILFNALYSTTTDLGTKASALQERSVINHMVELWLDTMKTMMKEAEWRTTTLPTVDEYMEKAYVSFGLGPIILPTLYFCGPKLSEDIINDPEYDKLFRAMSTSGRLLNDIQSFAREREQGKWNMVTLCILHGGNSISEDDVKREIQKTIDYNRRELLRLVLKREGSVVPRACKEVFWMMSKVCHLFYVRNDEYYSPKEMTAALNAVIHDPLEVGRLQGVIHDPLEVGRLWLSENA